MRLKMIKLSPYLLLLATVVVAWPAENRQGMSRVLVYQGKFRGIRPNPIFVDGVEVANLRHRWSYFVFQLSPGEHTIAGRHTDNKLVLQVSSGKDYFVRLDQIPGFVAADKPTLASCAETRTLVDSGKLHPVQPDDVRDHSR